MLHEAIALRAIAFYFFRRADNILRKNPKILYIWERSMIPYQSVRSISLFLNRIYYWDTPLLRE